MKTLIAAAALAAAVTSVTGCGLETASTAATAAAIKKQELDAGKKTMEQAQQKINESMQSLQVQQQRSESNAEK